VSQHIGAWSDAKQYKKHDAGDDAGEDVLPRGQIVAKKIERLDREQAEATHYQPGSAEANMRGRLRNDTSQEVAAYAGQVSGEQCSAGSEPCHGQAEQQQTN